MLHLVIGLISGAVGGAVVGALLKKLSLGTGLDALAGAVGGGVGSLAVTLLGLGNAAVPAAASGLDLAAIFNSVAAGGVGGGVLMALASVVKSATGR